MKTMQETLENCPECRLPVPRRFMLRHLKDCHTKISRVDPKPQVDSRIKKERLQKIVEYDTIATRNLKDDGYFYFPMGVRAMFVLKHMIVGDKIRVTVERIRE